MIAASFGPALLSSCPPELPPGSAPTLSPDVGCMLLSSQFALNVQMHESCLASTGRSKRRLVKQVKPRAARELWLPLGGWRAWVCR